MTQTEHPNVVVVVPHDAGDYLGCYGRRVETPNLDRLAAEGTRFTNHFCTSPLCSPARSSVITGTYPHTNGLMGFPDFGWHMRDSVVTDAQWFGRAGYRTFLVGNQHETAEPTELGFENLLLGGDSTTVAQTFDQLVADLANERAGASEARPFYIRVGTISAHRAQTSEWPYYGWEWAYEDGIAESDVEVLPQWLDTPRLRSDLRSFTGEMKRLDEAVGIMLDSLRTAGFDDDTIVVYVPDHGIDYPRAKSTLYDLGLRTAFILRAPAEMRRRDVVAELTSHIDVLPTLLDMCGIEADTPNEIQGVSLADAIVGDADETHTEIFAEESAFPRNLMRCIRTDGFKLIRNLDTGQKSNAGVCGPGVIAGSKRHYFVERPPLELYDLSRDPHELTNVAGTPEYRQVQAELEERLETWMRETHDPGLTGTIVRPPDEMDKIAEVFATYHNGGLQSEHLDLLWKDTV